MKTHGGVEKRRRRLTLCGIVVSAAQAPYSQPIHNITCGRCRRCILATWKTAIEDRVHASGYILNNPNE